MVMMVFKRDQEQQTDLDILYQSRGKGGNECRVSLHFKDVESNRWTMIVLMSSQT